MIKLIWRWLKRLTMYAWLLVLFLMGVVFAYKNDQLVTINLYGPTFEMSSGILVCVVFALGVVCGVLAVAPVMFWHRRRVKSLKKKHDALIKPSDPLSLPKKT